MTTSTSLLAGLLDLSAPSSALPGGTSSTVTTLFGYQIPDTITGLTAHTWTADANGLFHTATNLAQEWATYYGDMLAGYGGQLTAVQRLEGNAEAVFENTGLSKLSAAQQQVDREDLQREFDAIGAAQQVMAHTDHINPAAPLTQTAYLDIGQIIRSSPVLDQLAVEGHGLNAPPSSIYDGYTNDMQNNVDQATRYYGGGIDNGDRAIADLVDDTIITHALFPVVPENGHLVQLNQNGANESSLSTTVAGFNQSAYQRVYVASDFSASGKPASPAQFDITLPASAHAWAPPAVHGPTMTTLYGYTISTTITNTAHTWTAGADGLFHTGNLAAEWEHDYQMMLAGKAGQLTPEQRLQGNAEAVFEATGLTQLSAAQQQADREDAQREFDAIGAAMKIDAAKLGIDPTMSFTQQTWLALENTIQSSPALEQLAIEGHGLNDPPSAEYAGYTNGFQNANGSVTYVGGGVNNGENALRDLFDDVVMTHAPFPSIAKNGKLVQLNQNGATESSIKEQVAGINQTMFYRTYLPSDFKKT